jgi:hypothetical protein
VQRTLGTIDVDPLVGVGGATPSAWAVWQAEGGRDSDCTPSPYCGTAAETWWDWEERMWYLANLFRFLHADLLIQDEPATRSLSDRRFLSYDEGAVERFRVR